MGGKLDFAAAQIIGDRKNQEDAYRIVAPTASDSFVLCMLADGMGGHAAGEIAAQTAIAAFEEELIESQLPWADSFVRAIDGANRAIAVKTREVEGTEGMGCTFVGAEVNSTGCRWISIGDSPIFHISAAGIQRVNENHSMAPRIDAAAQRGEISWEEAQNSPSRNVLLSALTGENLNRFDYTMEPLLLSDGDWIIVATDGIETLQIEEIEAIVRSSSHSSATELCELLLNEVEERRKPRQDNTTVMVVSIRKNSTALDHVPTRPIKHRG